MRYSTKHERGFTLIELLVVIAIIAILASILFPVFNRVRESTRQASCISSLQEIDQDVKLYKMDFNKYPPILAAMPYYQNPAAPPAQLLYNGSAGTPVKAGQVLLRPFALATGQKLNQDPGLFQCPDNTVIDQGAVVHGAVYPPGVPLNGQSTLVSNGWFYTYDSYDTGPQINSAGLAVPGVRELHYTTDWTGVIGGADPINQLKYPDPPEEKTVVTWCTYHVSLAHSDQIIVLMLNGSAKATHYSKFVYQDATHPNGPLGFNP